jgi:hypothetical protein
MKVKELREILAREGIRDDAYALYGGTPDGSYVLSQEGQNWSVYYSDRGLKREPRIFSSEQAACEELLKRVLKDPTTRKTKVESNRAWRFRQCAEQQSNTQLLTRATAKHRAGFASADKHLSGKAKDDPYLRAHDALPGSRDPRLRLHDRRQSAAEQPAATLPMSADTATLANRTGAAAVRWGPDPGRHTSGPLRDPDQCRIARGQSRSRLAPAHVNGPGPRDERSGHTVSGTGTKIRERLVHIRRTLDFLLCRRVGTPRHQSGECRWQRIAAARLPNHSEFCVGWQRIAAARLRNHSAC